MPKKKDKFFGCLRFDFGFICVQASHTHLERVFFSVKDVGMQPNAITRRCLSQIDSYLKHQVKVFDCPVELKGTDFQVKVWKETMLVPYGQVITYKDLACRIGHPGAYRAVANALGANPLPLIVPCHRVIATTGLGGYTPGVEIKKFLLSLEGVTI